jgi:hypothetical protein
MAGGEQQPPEIPNPNPGTLTRTLTSSDLTGISPELEKMDG